MHSLVLRCDRSVVYEQGRQNNLRLIINCISQLMPESHNVTIMFSMQTSGKLQFGMLLPQSMSDGALRCHICHISGVAADVRVLECSIFVDFRRNTP